MDEEDSVSSFEEVLSIPSPPDYQYLKRKYKIIYINIYIPEKIEALNKFLISNKFNVVYIDSKIEEFYLMYHVYPKPSFINEYILKNITEHTIIISTKDKLDDIIYDSSISIIPKDCDNCKKIQERSTCTLVHYGCNFELTLKMILKKINNLLFKK